MSISSALALYAIIWWIVFFMFLPQWQRSQAEDGEVVPGTPPSAPADPKLRRKVIWTTAVSTVVFAIAYVAVEYRLVSLDWFGWATPPSLR